MYQNKITLPHVKNKQNKKQEEKLSQSHKLEIYCVIIFWLLLLVFFLKQRPDPGMYSE